MLTRTVAIRRDFIRADVSLCNRVYSIQAAGCYAHVRTVPRHCCGRVHIVPRFDALVILFAGSSANLQTLGVTPNRPLQSKAIVFHQCAHATLIALVALSVLFSCGFDLS